MTLPVIVSTATTTGSADPIVANLPSGIVSGDLLVMMVGTASGNTDLFGGDGGQGNWTIHTAWDASSMGYALLYKIADGTEGATHSFNVSATATFTVFVARITGANRANPLREFLHSATTSTSSFAVAGVTTTVDDSLVLYFAAANDEDSAPYSVSGTGWTEEGDLDPSPSTGISGTYGSRDMVSAGASGTATVAFTTTANAAGFQIAIAPDSGTPWIAGITDNIETTLATITMTKPTEAAIGDLLVLIIGNMYDNNSLAFPSTLTGWTMRWNHNGDGFRTQSACYTRVADGTEGATQDVVTSRADDMSGVYLAVRDTDINFHVLGDFVGSDIATVEPDQLTTWKDNCLILSEAVHYQGNLTPMFTNSVNWVHRTSFESDNTSTGSGFGLFQSERLTAGISDTLIIEGVGSDNRWVSRQLALAPTFVPSPAPAVRDNTRAITRNGTTLTLTKPADVANGDLLLLIVTVDFGSTTAYTDNVTGWTFGSCQGGGLNDVSHAYYYRIADGTEGATQDVVASTGSDQAGFYVQISGVDPNNIEHGYVNDFNSSTTTTHNIGGMTTTNDNTLALYWLAFDGGDGFPFSVSGTGWHQNDEVQTSTNTSEISACFGAKEMLAAGATGTATVTSTGADTSGWAQITFNGAPLDTMIAAMMMGTNF